jgi:rSAM/selenodomain-associated transferase 1
MSARRVIVFGRLPVLGRVKSRLASSVGEQRALDVHTILLERTLAVVSQAALGSCEFRFDAGMGTLPPEAMALPSALAERGWLVGPQRGADLGARMAEALASALDAGECPVLVGCDCPVLETDDLAAAFVGLETADAVFAPAEDGGYALVGVSRLLPLLFDAMPWGTSSVMAETRHRLAACGASMTMLRTVWDVDVEADLRRWEREGGTACPDPKMRR